MLDKQVDRDRPAQRLTLLDREQWRMRGGLVRDREAVEEGEQVVGGQGHFISWLQGNYRYNSNNRMYLN